MGGCCSTYNRKIPIAANVRVFCPISSTTKLDSKPYLDIHRYYSFKQIIGHGRFGTVQLATKKKSKTEIKYAIKTIHKYNIRDYISILKKELAILQESDHPNIISIYEAFEDEKNLHLVMEYCSGGDIFENLIDRGQFDEHRAAMMFEKILSAVYYLHSLSICHRDLKPENFLFISKDPNADLKCIDFGVSIKLGESEGNLHTMVGTPHYVAPEVLKKNYGKECDIWSLGVMLYVILSGDMPFEGKNRQEIFNKIIRGKFEFENNVWRSVSNEAKDLISRLLVLNPSERISIHDAFLHPWFNILKTNRGSVIPLQIFENLKNIRASSKLRQAAMKIVIQHLTLDEIEDLRKAFMEIDVDKTGFITADELQFALKMQGLKIAQKQFSEILDSVNYLGYGKITYTKFLIATINKKKLLNEERLYDVFNHFDSVTTKQTRKGFITIRDLQYTLKKCGFNFQEEELLRMLSEIDIREKNEIDFEEFKRIIMEEGKNYAEYIGSPLRCLSIS